MSFFKRLKIRYRRKMAASKTVFELSKLSNKDLYDLGISRNTIHSVAKYSAKERYPMPN